MQKNGMEQKKQNDESIENDWTRLKKNNKKANL